MSAYIRVVAASGLANLGDGIRQVALPLLAGAITKDAFLVGILRVPAVDAARTADRCACRPQPPRALRARCSGTAWCPVRGPHHRIARGRQVDGAAVCRGLLGVGEAAYANASQSLIPRVVDDRELEKANSALVTFERLGQDLVGPAVGGIIFAASAALPFAISAAALLIAGVLVIGIRTESSAVDGRPTPRAVLAEAADGSGKPHSRPVRA
jgi:hypothetical protein